MSTPTFLTPRIPLSFRSNANYQSNCNSPPQCSTKPSSQQPSLPPTSPSRRIFLSRLLQTTLLVFPPLPILSEESQPSTSSQPTPNPKLPPPPSSRNPLWSYSPPNDPSNWSSLSPDYVLLSTGTSQSPIPLSYRFSKPPPPSLSRPTLHTNPGKVVLRLRPPNPYSQHKWLMVQPYVPPPPALVGDVPPVDLYNPPPLLGVIDFAGHSWVFKEVHFHAGGSEHVVDGFRGVFEAHLIFEKRARGIGGGGGGGGLSGGGGEGIRGELSSGKGGGVGREEYGVKTGIEGDQERESEGGVKAISNMNIVNPAAPAEVWETGKKLVVGLLGVKAEKSEKWLERILDGIEQRGKVGEEKGVVSELDLGQMFPQFDKGSIYTYMGSLTTPPGTEGILWMVLGEKVGIAEREVKKLMALQGGMNVRPLQETNGRQIVRFPAVSKKED